MLTVKYGPFAALERAFLEDLGKRPSALAPAAVVAPSRALADGLQRLVAAKKGPTLALSFHTFYSLALEVLGESQEPLPRVVSEPMFFDRLIDSLLGNALRPRALAAAYRATLKDLIDAGVEPSARELVSEGLLKDASAAERLKEILGLLQAYEERLKALGVAPVSELTRFAAEAAPSSQALSRYRAFFYYGFYDLTGLQADFFQAVAREFEVTLYFPYLKGHPAFAFADRLFESKLHLGGAAPKPLKAAPPRALGPGLDALFQPGRAGAVPRGNLRLFTASGGRDEAWRVAKEVLRLVEEEGYAYRDIGVVARTLDPYRAAVAEAFGDARVPYHMSAGEPLLRRPGARLCLTLLTLARYDFPALAVLDVVESPLHRGRALPHARSLVRRLRIHRGWLQWEGKLAAAARADFELYPQESGRRGAKVQRSETAAFGELLRAWRLDLTPQGARTWPAWVEHARSFLSRNLDGAQDPGYLGALAAIEGLGALEGLDLVSFEEFLDAVEQCLERARLEPEPANSGVRVLDAMEARGDSFKVLFLVGLQQGLFPRTIREDPLLKDSARERLRDAGGYWIAPKQAGYEEEKLLFHLLASSASERLYCSYARSDEEGRAQVPSIYLMELCRACGLELGDPSCTEHVPKQPHARLSLPHLALTLTLREAALSAALAKADAGPLYRAMGLDERGFARVVGRIAELNRYGEPGALDGIVGEGSYPELDQRGLSPSGLESLARCPFQFFAQRVLGLGESEEPSERGEIAPALKGEIYHQALAAFYGKLPVLPEDFPEREFEAACEEAFGAYGWRELGVYPLLWEITRQTMRGHLRGFLEWDLKELRSSGFTPRLLEARFEGSLELPGGSAARLQGRLDRVDVGEGRFRVVDYKSRGRKGRLEGLVLGGLFQPPVYLELAARQPELRGLKPEGVSFYALEGADGQARVQEYSSAAHAANREAVLLALRRLVESVRRGRFLIRPEEGEFGHCRYCAFGGVCRKNHPMSRLRAATEEDTDA